MNKNYFQTLACYNQWANGKIYEAVSQLSPEEFSANCDVFFKSVQGTLNHVLVGDILWHARLIGEPRSDLKLDDILHSNIEDLTKAREDMDEELISFTNNMTDEFLNSDLRYMTISVGEMCEPISLILGHVFNHQTHHRSHVHACLTRLGKMAPDIDLIYYARERSQT